MYLSLSLSGQHALVSSESLPMMWPSHYPSHCLSQQSLSQTRARENKLCWKMGRGFTAEGRLQAERRTNRVKWKDVRLGVKTTELQSWLFHDQTLASDLIFFSYSIQKLQLVMSTTTPMLTCDDSIKRILLKSKLKKPSIWAVRFCLQIL